MKNRFGFRKRAITLDIAGQEFSLPVTMEMVEKLRLFGQEASQKAAGIPENEEGMREAWTFMAAVLDDLLGEGATARIFEGREENIYDLSDVLSYVAREVQHFIVPRRGRRPGAV